MMKNHRSPRLGAGIAALSILLLTAACDSGTSGTSGSGETGGTVVSGYAIGDIGPSGVGLVFYVSDGGEHGMEVAPEDQSASSVWSNVNDSGHTVGTSSLLGTGFENTEAIINQEGHATSAAAICRAYRADEEGDWFLPSQADLYYLWNNLVADDDDQFTDIGDFTEGAGYWTSTESFPSGNASYIEFKDYCEGIPSTYPKSSEFRVRAVRSF